MLPMHSGQGFPCGSNVSASARALTPRKTRTRSAAGRCSHRGPAGERPARRFKNPAELQAAISTIIGAIGARRRITRQSLKKTPSTASSAPLRKPPARLGPKKISVARLPVTGSDVFGREEDIVFLDRAWANKDVKVGILDGIDSTACPTPGRWGAR
jgi:hypothetical protein